LSHLQFIGLGFDQFDQPFALTGVSWSVDGGGSIDSTGLFASDGTTDSYTVTATSGTLAAMTSALNYIPSVEQLRISPNPAVIPKSSQQQFAASGLDQYLHPVSAGSVTWSVDTGGSITGTGLFTSNGTAGPCVVTVDSGTLIATSNLKVTTLTYLDLYPSEIIVAAPGQVQFVTFALDQSGVSFSPTNAAWSVNGGGTINSIGLLSLSGSTGNYTVTVTSGTASATATVHAYSTIADANGDGFTDWEDARVGIDPTNLDLNSDGLTNAQDIILGVDPFAPYIPPTPPPPPMAGDTTPPDIVLTKPSGAVLIP
jgi:hypothetical protein